MLDSKLISIYRKIWRGAAKMLLCSVALLLGHTGHAQVQPTNIIEFPIPSGNPCRPEYIVFNTNDAAYWFTEYEDELNPNKAAFIGRVDLSNNFTQIPISRDAKPFGIVNGPSNTMFFTESSSNANGIGRIIISGTNYTYVHSALPATSGQGAPWTLTAGPDGLLYFIEFNLNKIAAFSPNDTNTTLTLVHEFGAFPTNSLSTNHNGSLHVTNSGMFGLVFGPDNNLWFTESSRNVIGRIDTNGNNYTEFILPNDATPVTIIVGPDGALWFTEYTGNRIGRITTAGLITEFNVPSVNGFFNPQPDGLIVGPDNNLWFTEFSGSAVASMTTGGIFTVFPTPTANSGPAYLATGTDGNIWFTEFGSYGQNGRDDGIGKIVVAQALNLSSGPLAFTQSVTNGLTNYTFSNTLAIFHNSNTNNSVTLDWGDGTVLAVNITNAAAVSNLVVTTVVGSNTFVFTNILSVSNTVPIDTNTGNNGTFVIFATHTYIATNYNFAILTVNDNSNDVAMINTTALNTPAFFNGAVQITSFHAYDYLNLPDGYDFGFYFAGYFPFILHQEMGWEYFLDADVGEGECYMFDYTSGHWWYTSRDDFPFVYDFTLNAWLFYSPDVNNPLHYTVKPRWFYNFNTPGGWFNQ